MRTNPLYILHPIKLSKPTNQTSECIIKRAFQQAGEVKCRKKYILAHVYDIIAYLALLQSSALYEHCEINADYLSPQVVLRMHRKLRSTFLTWGRFHVSDTDLKSILCNPIIHVIVYCYGNKMLRKTCKKLLRLNCTGFNEKIRTWRVTVYLELTFILF